MEGEVSMDKQRLDRVLGYMEEEGLEQIVVTSTAAVYYLTGLWVEPHERMLALYLDCGGRTALFGNKMFGITQLEGLELILHTDSDDPVAGLARYVRPGVLGVDKFWPSRFLIGLMAARPDVKPVLGSSPVDTARRYKDEKEIAALRAASKINDQVVETAIAALADGISELELAALVNKTYMSLGADCSDGPQLVCFGPNAADPHHAPGPDTIQAGQCAVFDIFTPIGRYWCDMTRTVFYKECDVEARKVYDTVRQANLAGIAAVKPGVPLRSIDRAARSVIEEAGYGDYFTHRLGHGIGIECHEPPDVSAGSEAVAQPGMTFSIEPGIYLPGRLGVRVEDLVLVTEEGCEVLNAAPKGLRIVG